MVLQKVRRWVLICTAVFVSAYGVLLAQPATVQADGQDGSFISSQVSGKVLDHQLYFYAVSCFGGAGIDKITNEELNSWRWFEGDDRFRWRGDMYANNEVDCKEGAWLKEAFSRFGFTDPLDTYCSLEFAYHTETGGLGKTVNGGNSKESCKSGFNADNGNFDGSDGSDEGDFQAASLDKLLATSPNFNTARAPLTSAQEYVRHYRTLMRGCSVTLTQPYETGAASGISKAYKVTVVNQDGSTEDWLGIGGAGDAAEVTLVSTRGQDPKRTTCGELAVKARDLAGSYADYLKKEGSQDTPDEESGSGGNGADEPVCSAGPLGWVICPAINFIGEMNDTVYDVVETMLYIDPVTVETGGPLYNTWTRFRDIANILFVGVFLMVVFSQATSYGLSSYGIKKILPRIFAAAVLVNLSFFICQIALDVSNILGTSLGGLVDTMRSGAELDIDALSWATVITAALAGGGIVVGVGAVLAAGSITAALAMILPFLIMALFAVVTAIAVLIARQVIIILLIALSPLAFIAIVLPNTQKYFQLWQNTFTTMLIMFPLVALLFSGSQLAANIILTSATSEDGISFFALIAAVCMMFIPLFGVPYIVKFSGGTIGRIAGLVNNPNKGPFDALKKKAEGYGELKRDQARSRNLDPAMGTRGAFASYSRRKANKEDKYARAKDRAGRANQRYLSNMYSGENAAFDESKVDVSAAGGDPRKASAIIARAKQEAQTRAGERFATQQLGGQRAAHYTGGGTNLQAELNRARAGAISQENEESRKRSAAIEQLVTQREQGLDLNQSLEMYDEAYQEAAAAGDHETATAILRRSYSKGGPGRSQFAQMITKHQISGTEAQKHMEEAIYGIANDKRADVVKGGMDNSTGTWSLAGAGGMSYEQITSLDDKAMYRHLATISQEQADHILKDDNLKSQIQTEAAQQMLQMRAGNAMINPNAKFDPTDPNPNAKTWQQHLDETI